MLAECHTDVSFSNRIDLRLFFEEMTDYVIIKLPAHFPNYNDYEDIDILCNDHEQCCSHILTAFQPYKDKGFEMKVHHEINHMHLDVYLPGAERLNFRFDLLYSLNAYRKILVDPAYSKVVLASKQLINQNGAEVYVPALEHELSIRFLEYLEWKDEIPSKIKHLKYIESKQTFSFIPIINKYTNLIVAADKQQNSTLCVSYKAISAPVVVPDASENCYKLPQSCQTPGHASSVRAYGRAFETKIQRMDYFIIWGHGLKFTNQILDIIRNDSKLHVITIVRKHVDDIENFVQDIYACDTVPFEHLVAKTRYLLTTTPDIVFILVINKEPLEKYFGEGPFRHIQCQRIKDIKEEIRNKFNPRGSNGERTEHHVIHASDYESQVEHVLKVMGLPSMEHYKISPHPDIDAPYHLGKIDHLEIVNASIDDLRANILDRGLLCVTDTPHYRYVSGEKADYIQYHQKYMGTMLTDDHFPEVFDKMIQHFHYDDIIESGKHNLIVAKQTPDGKYQILDGVHRAAILAYQGISNFRIGVVKPENNDSNYIETSSEQSLFMYSFAQKVQMQHAQTWLNNNFYKEYDIICRSIELYMATGTLSIGRKQSLPEFFQGKEALWQAFVQHVIDKNCLEIGSGPCGFANYWHFIHKWHVIDPLANEYKQMMMKLFGKTWWWHWIQVHAQGAEKQLPELVGRINGVIVCRNTLDHVDDPLEVMNNIARYAAPGCKLLLWSDLYHLNGHDEVHRNVCRSRNLFKAIINNRGFVIEYETPMFRNGETMEYGCVAHKI
jgi:hypothetical protein